MSSPYLDADSIVREQIAVPDLGDPLFQPFWASMANGRLAVQRCAECGRTQWPPRAVCGGCRSPGVGWSEVPAEGTLYTWTTVERGSTAGYRGGAYAVGLVALDLHPSVRILGNIVGVSADELRIGMPLTAELPVAGPQGEFNIVQWRRTDIDVLHSPEFIVTKPGGSSGRHQQID